MTGARRVLVAVAGLLGSLAAVMGGPPKVGVPTLMREIAPVELASWIKERKPRLRIIDVRPEQDFDVFHLPNALNVPSSARLPENFEGGTTVVFYGEGDFEAQDLPSAEQARPGWESFVLRQGLNGWLDEVMNPVLPDGASMEDKAAFERAAELSRYFGGLPRSLSAAESVDFKRRRPSVTETKRRGC